MVEQLPFKELVESSSLSGLTILEITEKVGATLAAPASGGMEK